jgi:hypothetical protein
LAGVGGQGIGKRGGGATDDGLNTVMFAADTVTATGADDAAAPIRWEARQQDREITPLDWRQGGKLEMSDILGFALERIVRSRT